jgi:hypothetical protein
MPKPANRVTNWNISEIARRLGVPITTASRKLASSKTEAEIIEKADQFRVKQERRNSNTEDPATEFDGLDVAKLQQPSRRAWSAGGYTNMRTWVYENAREPYRDGPSDGRIEGWDATESQ